MTVTVVVLGVSGFIGSAVAREAVARGSRVVGVARSVRATRTPSMTLVRGDVLDADLVASVSAQLGDGDAIIHCAHPSPGSASADFDVEGVRPIMRARRPPRLVVASTTAVYGHGRHENLSEDAAETRPQSALSRLRLEIEERAVALSGSVLRTPLTIGRGDRWVVPAVLDAQRGLGWIDGGRSRHTVAHVRDVASALLEVAARPLGARIFHVGYRRPLSVRELTERVADQVGVELSDEDIDLRRAAAAMPATAVQMLSTTHSYDVTSLERAIGIRSRDPVAALSRADLQWYRSTLAVAT